jgi:hypothetical protein
MAWKIPRRGRTKSDIILKGAYRGTRRRETLSLPGARRRPHLPVITIITNLRAGRGTQTRHPLRRELEKRMKKEKQDPIP